MTVNNRKQEAADSFNTKAAINLNKQIPKEAYNEILKGSFILQLAKENRGFPKTYSYLGEEKSIKEFIKSVDTTGLMVMKDEKVVFEEYYNGNTSDSHSLVFSVTKSFVSALIGCAIEEEKIESIKDPIIKYCPELSESGYRGVTIENLLRMTSGVDFCEDYGNPKTEIYKLAKAMYDGTSMTEFIKTLKNSKEPGTFPSYVSTDTQVLGMVLTSAINKTISEYATEKLWKPLGMSSDAFMLVDTDKKELATGGLNITLSDMVRFGMLYKNNGEINGKQIIPKQWVIDSTSVKEDMSGNWNYGYQWWLPKGNDADGEFVAMGVFGQAIYVNPRKNIIIAKTALYRDYVKLSNEMESETIALFREIANKMS